MKRNGFLSGGWAVIVPLTGAIIVYLMFAFFPQMREIRRLRDDIVTQQAYLSAAAKNAAREQAVDVEIAATRDYVRQYRGAVTEASQAASLFSLVTQFLRDSNLKTTAFRPEAKQSLVGVERFPLSIACRGSHVDTQALLARLEALDQRVWVDELLIEGNREDAQEVTCQVKLAIFINKFEILD